MRMRVAALGPPPIAKAQKSEPSRRVPTWTRVGVSDRQAAHPSVGQVSWVLRYMTRKPVAPPRVTCEPRIRGINLLDHPGRNIHGRLAVVVADELDVEVLPIQGHVEHPDVEGLVVRNQLDLVDRPVLRQG